MKNFVFPRTFRVCLNLQPQIAQKVQFVKIIFNRIPKTGSTSLVSSLKILSETASIPLNSIHHWPHANTIQTLSGLDYAISRGSGLIEGHLPLGMAEWYLKKYNFLTHTVMFVRDFRQRAISHLSYLLSRNALCLSGGQIRYVSQPYQSLSDILCDHCYRWFLGFYAGLSDSCDIYCPNDFSQLALHLSPAPLDLISIFNSVSPSISILPLRSDMHDLFLHALHLRFSVCSVSGQALAPRRDNVTPKYLISILNCLLDGSLAPGQVPIYPQIPGHFLNEARHQLYLINVLRDAISPSSHDSSLQNLLYSLFAKSEHGFASLDPSFHQRHANVYSAA